MKFIYGFMVLVFVLLGGCTSNHSVSKDDNLSSRNLPDSAYQILKSGIYPHDGERYLHGKQTFLTFYSDDEKDINAFEKEYTLLTGEVAPVFDGTVVIAKMGTQKNGGYGYGVKEIVEGEKYIEVRLLFKKPSLDEIVTMALTNPYIVILLPKNHKEVKVVQE